MKKSTRIVSLLLCLVILLSLFPTAAFAADAKNYLDVKKGDWYYESVNEVTERNLFNGTDGSHFSPDGTMTRAMLVAVLYRMAGSPAVTVSAGFEDVVPGSYYAAAVDWAKSAGIIGGTDQKRFCPNDPVTREQLVQMLYLYYTVYMGIGAVDSKALDAFKDAGSVSSYALDAMRWACGNGVVSGAGAKLSPQANASRAQVAEILMRFLKLLDALQKTDTTPAAPSSGSSTDTTESGSHGHQSAEPEQRIVCMAPSMVEVVYALGYGSSIVGWSAYTDYPVAATQTKGYDPYGYYYYTDTADFSLEHELGKEVAVVSKYYDYNAKILAALHPTMILCEGTEQEPWVKQLTDEGYTNVHCYTPETIDDIYDMMLEVGGLLGCKARARKLVTGYYKRIEEIKAITSKLTVIPTYFEIAHQSDYGEYGVYGPYTEGGNTPFTEMIEIAGGKNIFSDQKDYVNLNEIYPNTAFAEIVSRNPQVILSPYWPNAMDQEVTTIYEIMTRPGFNTTNAVKDGRVYYYDSSLMKRFGPRTITAIEKLAYLLHPYYFSNPKNSVSPWELGKIDKAEQPPAPLD